MGTPADFTVETATDAVVESFRETRDRRLRQVMQSLTRHLHDFVRDIEPTMDGWEAAIGFLTAVGHTCDDTRQELVLLSDVLGVSMLVETLNGSEEGTESTVRDRRTGALNALVEAGLGVERLRELPTERLDVVAAAVVHLTSVRQPAVTMGALAAEAPHQHHRVVLQPELVVRRSSLPRR